MARLAMVTGASSGIGEAYARRLAQEGWDLVVVARRRERLEALASELTAQHRVAVRAVEADLARQDHRHALCAEISAGPALDMLVNNAGLGHYMPFTELPPELAEELVRLDVLAPVMLTRAAVAGMRERSAGTIVNFASLLAFSGGVVAPHLPARAVYAATRSFMVTFTQVLAAELEGEGVRAQVVCPGVVRTEFHSRQGIDLSAVPRMEPDDVVQASLRGLELGEVVCIPGLGDVDPLERLTAAERELMGWTRVRELADRYR